MLVTTVTCPHSLWNLMNFLWITKSQLRVQRICLPSILSKETNNKINFEKLFFKTHNCNPFQSSLSLSIPALFCICIGSSMICSDIWHKYHEWYFEIVIRISRVFRRVKFETTLKYHEWHLWQISVTNLACVQTSPLPHKKIGRRDVCESPSLIAFLFIIYANVTGTRLTTAIHRRLFYRFFSEGRGRLCTGYYKSCYYLFILSLYIVTCRYFKLSWNTTALSQSNCRNFSCSKYKLCYLYFLFMFWVVIFVFHLIAGWFPLS